MQRYLQQTDSLLIVLAVVAGILLVTGSYLGLLVLASTFLVAAAGD